MSILVGDIARARLSRDVQRHLDEEEALRADPSPGPDGNRDGVGYDGSKNAPEIGGNDDPCPAYLLQYSPGLGGYSSRFLSPVEFGTAITVPRGVSASSPGRLLVLHGLPTEYVRYVLRDRDLDMDPAFLDAHAERRGYRPVGRWCECGATFESWEYPELVQGFGREAERYLEERGDMVDGMRAPGIHPLGRGDLAVVFCRVALWASAPTTPILFLDRPVWSHPASPLRRAHQGLSVTVRSGEDRRGPRAEGKPETSSLEDALWRTLAADINTGFPDGGMLAELAFNSWLDLFETLEPPAHHDPREATATCYWRILSSLEKNKHAASLLFSEPRKRKVPAYIDWDGLLSQAHQRVALLAATPISKQPRLSPVGTAIVSSQRADPNNISALGATGTLPPGRTPGRSGRGVLDDENHRALDRISYLGGILIPLPIVSGILSMGETFGPDGPKFFVFWAASIPLAVLAVMIIYADTIRKAEVWVEVAAEHVAALSTSSDAEGAIENENEKKDGLSRRHTPSLWQDVEAQTAPCSRTRILGAASKKIPERTGKGEEYGDIDIEGEVVLPVLVNLGPGQGSEPAHQSPEMILEESADGRKPKAWKRQKLGWYGAAKAIVYHKPRYCANEAPPGVAAYDKRRRKTQTY